MNLYKYFELTKMKTQNTSPLNVRRLSKLERSQFSLSDDLKAILVGLYLGDLCAVKFKKGINVGLHFEQGNVNKDYLFHLYELFQSYCLTAPKISNRLPDKRTGLIYTRVKFATRTLPCFNELYDNFYPEGIKIIPKNIGDLLTPLSLGYWLADDGSFCKSSRRIILCTESFSPAEVLLLINVLNSKWDLKCYKSKRGESYRITIPRKSLPIIQQLLKDIMPPMMKHKIGL